MKKINTLFVMLLLISTVILSNQAKAQSCPWAYKAGGIAEDNGAAVATDASGNVYYLGNFYSQTILFGTTTLHNQAYADTSYGAEIFLVKYDSCGTFVWAKQAGGNAEAHGTCITIDASGNIYIGGYFSCSTLNFGAVNLVNAGGSMNAFVAKYNSSGVAQWAKGGGGDAQNYTNAIALDASGNVYATGYFGSDVITFGTNSITNGSGSSGINDLFIAKFDNNGNNLWLKGNTSNGDFSNSGSAVGNGIGVDASGNVYVDGTFESAYIRFGTDSLPTAGSYDIFLVKYNTGGTFQWLKTAGGTDDDEAFGLATDATGNSYLTGHIGASATASFGSNTLTNPNFSFATFLAKYDNAGNPLWARGGFTDNGYNTLGNHVTLDAAGNPYVIGYYNSDSLILGPVTLYNNSNSTAGGANDSADIFVAKYKANGNLSWARTAGGTGNDFGYGIATGPHNSLYICGEFDSPTLSVTGITLTITPGNGGGMGDAFIANNISTSPVTPSICMVTTDSLSINNVIFWDNTYPGAASYVIYREVSSVYASIGVVSKDSLSQFIDTSRSVGPSNGNPNVGAYRYKLQIIDTAGTASLLSPYHNTIFITQGTNGVFSWATNYTIEGQTTAPDSIYVLACDTANTHVWTTVAVQAGSQQQIADPGFIHHANIANWRVDALGFHCFPTTARLPANNSVDAAKVKSHSNTNNNRGAGINKITGISQQVSVYPNPSNGNFVVETNATEKQTVQIYDVTGKLVLTQSLTGKASIDAGSLNEGVYNISISGSEGVVNKRMVIVR